MGRCDIYPFLPNFLIPKEFLIFSGGSKRNVGEFLFDVLIEQIIFELRKYFKTNSVTEKL